MLGKQHEEKGKGMERGEEGMRLGVKMRRTARET